MTIPLAPLRSPALDNGNKFMNDWQKWFNQISNAFNNSSIMFGTDIPASGNYSRGDIILNTLPSAGGFIGWVCVQTGGNPPSTAPVWKTWGAISA